MSTSLMDRLLSAGTIKETEILSKTKIFDGDTISTDIPILNVAFSGRLDGGFGPGLTVLAGASKSFKTMLGLKGVKSFLEKYPDGVVLFYDSEFGALPSYLENMRIDTTRIIHIPIMDIEELKFDIIKRLEEIKKGKGKDKVMIFIDSVGNLASKKEIEDAKEQKSVADMTRAKQMKSLFRMITPYLTICRIPCFVINHVYKEQGMYPKDIVSGGTGIYYSANTIFIITKEQVKEGTEIVGFTFKINIEKSRTVREKAKLPFTVTYKGGISRYGSLFDLALEGGFIRPAKKGWFTVIDPETGEVAEKSAQRSTILKDKTFFENLVACEPFKTYVESRYLLTLVDQGDEAGVSDNDDDEDFEE